MAVQTEVAMVVNVMVVTFCHWWPTSSLHDILKHNISLNFIMN